MRRIDLCKEPTNILGTYFSYKRIEKALKGVQAAVCVKTRIDLCNEANKILGTYFSHNKRITEECNFFKIISNVQSLIFEGRIVVFKSLAISKIVFQSLIAPVPNHIIKVLETIQTSSLWTNSSPKIDHKTISKNYGERDLQNVDISNKLTNLQISWVKRLFNRCFHESKIIPLYQLKNKFGPSFKFYSNIYFNKSFLKKLLSIHRHMLKI